MYFFFTLAANNIIGMRSALYTLIILCSFYATQAQTRMVAEGHYRYDAQLAQDVMYDSTVYTYLSNSGRGCAAYEVYNFDTSYLYYINAGTPTPVERKLQWFDTQDRITTRNTENN